MAQPGHFCRNFVIELGDWYGILGVPGPSQAAQQAMSKESVAQLGIFPSNFGIVACRNHHAALAQIKLAETWRRLPKSLSPTAQVRTLEGSAPRASTEAGVYENRYVL
jgi:hypothetical protein